MFSYALSCFIGACLVFGLCIHVLMWLLVFLADGVCLHVIMCLLASDCAGVCVYGLMWCVLFVWLLRCVFHVSTWVMIVAWFWCLLTRYQLVCGVCLVLGV